MLCDKWYLFVTFNAELSLSFPPLDLVGILRDLPEIALLGDGEMLEPRRRSVTDVLENKTHRH